MPIIEGSIARAAGPDLLAPVTTTVDYAASSDVETIIANVSVARTITLPSPASIALGKTFRVIKLDQSMQAVRIVSAAGELIGGQAMVAVRQFRETLQIISDGSAWHLINRGVSQVANAHDFGARGDLTVDEQPALQACIDYAIANNLPVFVPGGRYKLNASLSFIGLSGLVFAGAGGQVTSASESGGSGTSAFNANGTQLFWYGNQTTPMFLIEDCRTCLFENFTIQGNTAGACYVGLEICALASSQPRGATTTPTRNTFRKIHMNGTNGTGLIHGVRLPHPTNSLNAPANLVDANNDFCVFDGIEIVNSVVGYSFDASQQKSHMMRNCMVVGSGTTQLAAVLIGCPISSADLTPAGVTFNAGAVGGSFFWIGGGGGHSQIADVLVGNVGNDAYELADVDFESSVRFIAMQPTTLAVNAQSVWTIRGSRWAHAGQGNADGKFIIFGTAGVFRFQGNSVQDSGSGLPLQIAVNVPSSNHLRMAIEGNELDSTLGGTSDLVMPNTATTDRFQYTQSGNTGVNKSAGSASFKWPDYDYASKALRIAGGAPKTANSFLTIQDELVLAGDTGAAGITITLPDATLCKGVTKRVIRTSASFTTTIGSTSSQTINGAAASTFNLTAQYQVLVVISDGANWLKLN